MNIGMLWLDDDKHLTLEEKIQRAADYYLNKYGQSPNICLVNQTMLKEEKKVGPIQVRPVQNILRNHFWVGIQTV
jgi:hypothetical protein